MTARLAQICRHPIKAHGRETIPQVRLQADRCMPWDRRWAVAHEAARLDPDGPAWAACGNFSIGSKAPLLMAIEARLDTARAEVTLTHPLRPDISIRPDDTDDAARFVDWVRPLCPPDRALPARIVTVPDRGMTDTDYPSISLINLGSNAALGKLMGADLSPHRWRGNLWLDGLEPWEETGLIGRHLRIGSAVLEVVEPITRCKATSADPMTGRIDVDTLGALQGGFGHQDFGLYARVVESGDIAVGDGVEVTG